MIDRAAGRHLGWRVPLSLSLFGGYRRDDFEAALRLHAADLECYLRIVCG